MVIHPFCIHCRKVLLVRHGAWSWTCHFLARWHVIVCIIRGIGHYWLHRIMYAAPRSAQKVGLQESVSALDGKSATRFEARLERVEGGVIARVIVSSSRRESSINVYCPLQCADYLCRRFDAVMTRRPTATLRVRVRGHGQDGQSARNRASCVKKETGSRTRDKNNMSHPK